MWIQRPREGPGMSGTRRAQSLRKGLKERNTRRVQRPREWLGEWDQKGPETREHPRENEAKGLRTQRRDW